MQLTINRKVSTNEHPNNEDKNKQIHSKIKMHNEHLKNITKIDKYKKTKKTEQHFYDGIQNTTQLHFSKPSNKHMQIQQRRNKPQNFPRKRLTKIFNQQLTSLYSLYYITI